MNVEQLMSKPVCTVEPESTLAEATTVMGERHVGSALICDGEELLGILTERDVVRAISNAFDAPMRPVAEWMTKRPTTTGPETPVKEALRIMVDGGFRHLPILQDGKVLGIVSMRDIARALAD